MTMPTHGNLLTTRQAAERIAMTEQALKHLRYAGIGPVYIKYPSGTIRYRAADVDMWINTSIVQPRQRRA